MDLKVQVLLVVLVILFPLEVLQIQANQNLLSLLEDLGVLLILVNRVYHHLLCLPLFLEDLLVHLGHSVQGDLIPLEVQVIQKRLEFQLHHEILGCLIVQLVLEGRHHQLVQLVQEVQMVL